MRGWKLFSLPLSLCLSLKNFFFNLKSILRDFPSRPVVKNPHFYCRGHGFDPGLGNEILHASPGSLNINKNKILMF